MKNKSITRLLIGISLFLQIENVSSSNTSYLREREKDPHKYEEDLTIQQTSNNKPIAEQTKRIYTVTRPNGDGSDMRTFIHDGLENAADEALIYDNSEDNSSGNFAKTAAAKTMRAKHSKSSKSSNSRSSSSSSKSSKSRKSSSSYSYSSSSSSSCDVPPCGFKPTPFRFFSDYPSPRLPGPGFIISSRYPTQYPLPIPSTVIVTPTAPPLSEPTGPTEPTSTEPTPQPTSGVTTTPTVSQKPSVKPSAAPSSKPTISPAPTTTPTKEPTNSPTITSKPTAEGQPVSNCPSTIFINEFKYDGSGFIVAEIMKFAFTDGFDYTGYTVEFYNPSGEQYQTDNVDKTVGNDSQESNNGFSFRQITLGGFREDVANGGMALLDAEGVVVPGQFLCFGIDGTITGTTGAINGLTCENIGLSQDDDTPATESIQLTGNGYRYEDFEWVSGTIDASPTPGANEGQTFQCPAKAMASYAMPGVHR